MIADETQAIEERSTYKPFGEENESVLAASKAQETIGWIGERHDAGAGLQYLNARYYDPELGLFIQPDWFEVTRAGVGTNRYSYSFNDPVNFMDPSGNQGMVERAISDFFQGLANLPGELADRYKEGLERLKTDPLGHLADSAQATVDYAVPGAYHSRQAIGAAKDGHYGLATAHATAAVAEAGLAASGAHLARGPAKATSGSVSPAAKAGSQKGQVGSYTITFDSGKTYSGKGPLARAEKSAAEKAKQNDDKVLDIDWSPSQNDRQAFIDEAARMRSLDWNPKSNSSYNKIASPGYRYGRENGLW